MGKLGWAWIVLLLVFGKSLPSAWAIEPSRPSMERLSAFFKSDETYRPLVPTASANIGETKVNETLRDAKVCQFYPDDSNTVLETGLCESDRVKIVPKTSLDFTRNGRMLLEKCEQMRRALGDLSCRGIELAGHANGMSIGVGKMFGFRVVEGRWRKFPEDDALFSAIGHCLTRLLEPGAPVVFTTCGGSHAAGEVLPELKGAYQYYAKKHEAQQLMADILHRPVISGLAAVHGTSRPSEAECLAGWHIAQPRPGTGKVAPQLETDLPRLVPLYEVKRLPFPFES